MDCRVAGLTGGITHAVAEFFGERFARSQGVTGQGIGVGAVGSQG